MLEHEADNLVLGARELESYFSHPLGANGAERIKRIETAGDGIVHDIFADLNSTFITPIDHEDISALALLMDDVLDASQDAIVNANLFRIKSVPPEMKRMAGMVLSASGEIRNAVALMRRMEADKIDKHCIEINRLRNESDELRGRGLVKLFRTGDAIEIIKMKEVYNNLSVAMDKAEDVASVIGDIVMKNR